MTQIYLTDNDVAHIEPNTFLSKPNLTVVHLDSNKIMTLDMASLMVSLSPEQGMKIDNTAVVMSS